MNTILQQRIEEAAKKVSDVCEPCDYGDPFCASCHRPYMYDAAKKMGEVILNNQRISVEEALPEEDEQVIAMSEFGDIERMKYHNKAFYHLKGNIIKDGEKITHWMEIPSLKGGE